MAYKNFYSGNGNFSEDDKILHKFMEGKHFVKTTGVIEDIPKGATKYNKEIIFQLKELNSLYGRIIAVESCAIAFTELHVDKQYVYGMMRNIFNLMHSQKGTRNWITHLIKACFTYQVRHQDVYTAFKRNIASMSERYQRNQNVVNDFFKDYGFHEFVNYIENKTGTTVYEDMEKYITSQYSNLVEYSDEEYKNIAQSYVNKNIEEAKQQGFNLCGDVSEVAKTHYEHRKKLAAETNKLKKEKKDNLFIEKCDSIVAIDNNAFMKTLNSGMCVLPFNLNEKSMYRYANILTNFGGVGYYIVTVHGTSIYYITEEGKESQNRNKIFISNNLDVLNEIKTKFIQENPNIKYIKILSISLLSSCNKIEHSIDNAPIILDEMGTRLVDTLAGKKDDVFFDTSDKLQLEKKYAQQTLFFILGYIDNEVVFYSYDTNQFTKKFKIYSHLSTESIIESVKTNYPNIIVKQFCVSECNKIIYNSVISILKTKIVPYVKTLPNTDSFREELKNNSLYCVLSYSIKSNRVSIATSSSTMRTIGYFLPDSDKYNPSELCCRCNIYPKNIDEAKSIKQDIEYNIKSNVAIVCKVNTNGDLEMIC